MINLGIDFGSTYTMASILDNGIPVTVQPNHLSYNYPSIVCYDSKRDKYFFGGSARDKIGKPDIITYRSFKMLLAQQTDEAVLSERGYNGVNTPEYITELFLRHVITKTLANLKEDKVDLLVLGAPECWFQSLQTVDARGTLRDICLRFGDLVNRFELRSEPTDAAAFCVWSYEQKQKEKFNGKILVVDYGGGTLDTAMVSVTHINDKIQVKPEILSGIGENREKKIGRAGIAYQEAVVRKAISQHSGTPENEIVVDKCFDRAVKQFEDALVSDCEYVDDIFTEFEAVPEDLQNEHFTSLEYGLESVSVNFAQMKSAYNETIYSSLKKVLDESMSGLEKGEQPYLALVGGFCNFYLVREQIKNHFNLGGVNGRVKMLFHREDEREKAIAYGACLLANSVIEVCHVAGFGISMAVYNGKNELLRDYAISYGQEYIPDKIYFIKHADGKNVPMVLTEADKFLLNFGKRSGDGVIATPKKKFAEELKKSTKNSMLAVVGFSIDAAERIKVHIFDYDPDAADEAYGKKILPKSTISLSTFKGSFHNLMLPPGGGNR
ncbi:MAG: Hsp70 family protein [Ruminococcus sp.]|nr:Hsp70 family protein [Ruminococcus sp.]